MELFIKLDVLMVHECVTLLPLFFSSFYPHKKLQSYKMLAKESHIYVNSQAGPYCFPHRVFYWLYL